MGPSIMVERITLLMSYTGRWKPEVNVSKTDRVCFNIRILIFKLDVSTSMWHYQFQAQSKTLLSNIKLKLRQKKCFIFIVGKLNMTYLNDDILIWYIGIRKASQLETLILLQNPRKFAEYIILYHIILYYKHVIKIVNVTWKRADLKSLFFTMIISFFFVFEGYIIARK